MSGNQRNELLFLFPIITFSLFYHQYMIAALGDCVPVLQQVKHEPSAQVMLESFEKEIGDTLHEVSMLKQCLSLFCQRTFVAKHGI